MSMDNPKVFIVHGHDNKAKSEAESLIYRFGMKPIILHRSPNKGRTIIEKIEQESDVSYAIVLLTPDDEGGPKDKAKYFPRARQNVIFELGYLFARLGRERVICLLKENVEKPSDIDGIVYLAFKESIDEIEMDLKKEFESSDLKLSHTFSEKREEKNTTILVSENLKKLKDTDLKFIEKALEEIVFRTINIHLTALNIFESLWPYLADGLYYGEKVNEITKTNDFKFSEVISPFLIHGLVVKKGDEDNSIYYLTDLGLQFAKHVTKEGHTFNKARTSVFKPKIEFKRLQK